MPHYPQNPISKLPHLGTTIFSVMSRMAEECGAINLSQGFPDFACDPALLQGVQAAMLAGHNQYAPMPGLLDLRQQLSEKLHASYGTYYDPEQEITITAGATQGIYTALTALVQAGDEVILFEPAYDSYAPALVLQGAIPVRIALAPPTFDMDWDQIAAAITPRTRMIIINTPNNPGSSVLSADDLLALRELVCRHNLLVLADEVYEHMVYDGQLHQSMARDAELAARSLIVYSFGKTFHVTGWKIGYCVGPARLMAEFRKVHQFLVFAVNTPMQHALAGYLRQPEHYRTLTAMYQSKRDYLRAGLATSRFRLLPCAGSYFQLLDYSDISTDADTRFAEYLTREHGVAAIPLSPFYADGRDHKLIRLCFAKQQATLDAALQRLVQV